MPMRMNNSVHTIGNKYPGGASAGLLRVSNISMLLRVINAETPPTTSGIATQMISFLVFDFNIITSMLLYETSAEEIC